MIELNTSTLDPPLDQDQTLRPTSLSDDISDMGDPSPTLPVPPGPDSIDSLLHTDGNADGEYWGWLVPVS